MPSITITKLFEPVQLATSASAIFTMPAAPTTQVTKNMQVKVTNTTSGSVTVTLYAVPASGTESDANAFAKDEAIPAKSSVTFNVPTLKAGDVLKALASAATSLTIHEAGGNLYTP